MLIGIDTSRITKPHLTGTETYCLEIIKAMAKLDETDDFLLYAQKDPRPRLGNLPDNFKVRIIPFPKLWSQIRLSWEMLVKKPDVLFVPSHLVPIIHPKNTVVTLHDLGFKHFPELYPPKELLYHNWGMNFSAKHGKKIITPSEFTKKDLIQTYTLNPDKISVVWHGIDQEFFKPNPDIKKKKTIFFIGRLEEKKNIIGMIRAYEFLRKEQSVKHKLILAGSPGYGYENIVKTIETLPQEIRHDIILPGYVSQKEYLKFLQEADIFLFTTFFEGFGLPVIEAMSAGVPVVASNTTSIPEITANAAVLCDPKNPLQIAAACSKIINSDRFKKSLILKGRVRAKIFTWEKAAQKTLEVLIDSKQ